MKRLAVVVLLVVGLWLGTSFAVAWKLSRRRAARYEEAPLASHVRGSEERWAAHDGLTGSWWWTPSDSGTGPVVLLLHSLGSTREEWAAVVEGLAARGVASAAATLRCHGGSDGEVLEFGRAARLDVLALVAAIEERAPERPVVVVGRSFGAAAALFAAAELGPRVAAYVLEAPYSDLSTAVRNRTRRELGGFLGEVAAAGIRLVAPAVLDDPGSFAPSQRLRDPGVAERVLLVAGALDEETELWELEAMSRSTDPPVRLEVFEDATHCRCLVADPERWWKLLEAELARARR